MQEDFTLFTPTNNISTTIFHQEKSEEEEEIDERIDIHDYFSLGNQQEEQPLRSPDLLKYYYITQLLRARSSPGNNKGYFEDWMFKEQVAAAAAAAANNATTQ